MAEILRTEYLSKHFGPVRAVDNLCLNVYRGEIYGFLGLNGAGKTTTIRMLLGMIRPTTGSAFLFGGRVDPGRIDLWRKVGYLVEIPYSYPELTVRENLEIYRRLRRIDRNGAVGQVIGDMKLESYRNRKANSLSTGNAQRLGLAKALLHRPEILILDEPANGLDPAGIVEIRELLQELAVDRGVTIFISSHILGEIARLATRIGIIHEGRLIQELDRDEMERRRHRRLLVQAVDVRGAVQALTRAGYEVNRSLEGILELPGPKAWEHPEKVATLLVREGVPPTRLQVEVEELEPYFLRIVGSNSKGGRS